MPDIGAPEIIIIAIVILILFGTKKMPDAARSLGRTLRIFKSETRGLRADEEQEKQPQAMPKANDVLIDGRPLDPPTPADSDRRDGR